MAGGIAGPSVGSVFAIARHVQPGLEEFVAQREHPRELRRAGRLPLRRRRLLQVAVVGMQSAGAQPGRQHQRAVEPRRLRPGRDARAVHPDIEVEEHVDDHVGGGGRPAQGGDRTGIVGDGREPHVRKGPHERHEPGGVRPHGLRGEEHVFRAGTGRHLGLRDGRRLAPGDTQARLERHDLRELVGLDMRSQPLRRAHARDHPSQVLLHTVRKHEQRGRDDFGLVGQLEAGVGGQGVGVRIGHAGGGIGGIAR